MARALVALVLALPFGLALAYVAAMNGTIGVVLCAIFGVSVYVLILGLLNTRRPPRL